MNPANSFPYPQNGIGAPNMNINPAVLAAQQAQGNKFPYGGTLGGFNLNPQMFQQTPQIKPRGPSQQMPQQFYDGQRPGSSAQNMNPNMQMAMSMPPPSSVPPRPSTAASSPSRPGTAQSHASNPGASMMSPNGASMMGMNPGAMMNAGAVNMHMNPGAMMNAHAGANMMNAGPANMMSSNAGANLMNMNMNPNGAVGNMGGMMSANMMNMNAGAMSNAGPLPPRTPSRPPTSNGYPPQKPPTPSQAQAFPGSPFHGVKRKLTDSPRMGMGHGVSTPVSGGSGEMQKRQASAPAEPKPASIPALPPLPRTVSLNPATTKVTVVPLAGSDKAIPGLSSGEVEKIKEWMKVDGEYEGRWRRTKERMEVEMREGWVNGAREVGGVNGSVVGPAWWEKGFVGFGGEGLGGRRGREKFGITYPKKAGDGRRRLGRREGLKLPRKISEKDASRVEQLVPIRLEFDVDHHKMRDTFVWNINDPVVTPEIFAQSIVDDYNMPQSYHSTIVKSIQEQLTDFRAHSSEAEEGEVHAGALGEEDAAWWEGWRKRMKVSNRGSFVRKGKGVAGGEKELWGVEELVVEEEGQKEEMRVVIKLDIIVGSIKLDDQIEWDLNNEDASPEHFAEVYGRELGLAGEFITAIAHSIREQIQTFQKSLFLVGHPSDGTAVQDDDLRMTFLPPLTSAARTMDQVQFFTPMLNYMDDSEIEKSEREREKEVNRRRKRNTRGRRGVALPDREPMRTYRTPAIGFPEVDPATLAAAALVNVPTRRAAAAAASVTIANMVASENGQAVPTPQMPVSLLPSVSTAQTGKEKKGAIKGLFKPPELPAQAFRPRAKVKAPTESTAADTSLLPPPLADDPPVSGPGAPDSSVSVSVRPGKAKTQRELEREAKEKEYADVQHPNFIDGVWHCSNCGCPESIAVGRRKGPLGDKTQCGQCGKYWHRHRRPRPVDYNSSADYHRNLLEEAERAKVIARKKGGAAALRAMSAATEQDQLAAAGPSGSRSRPNSVARSVGRGQMWVEVPPPAAATEAEDDKQEPISPISTGSSSGSESPLANRIRTNGINHTTQSGTPVPRPTSAADAPASTAPSQTANPQNPSSWNHANPAEPPEWLSAALQAMRERYPQDRFETICKKLNPSAPPEWRIKCLDCPGKLYTPGPGETLSNYEVHLKNRQHRQRVANRIESSGS